MAADDLLTTIRAEIDTRLSELRPLLAEHERLLSAADALAWEGREPSNSPPPRRAAKRTTRPKTARPARGRAGRPSIGPAGQAIVAALEHGSHTVAELVVVTALPAPDIRDSLRGLRKQRVITKTDRDGKSAYALSNSA